MAWATVTLKSKNYARDISFNGGHGSTPQFHGNHCKLPAEVQRAQPPAFHSSECSAGFSYAGRIGAFWYSCVGSRRNDVMAPSLLYRVASKRPLGWPICWKLKKD